MWRWQLLLELLLHHTPVCVLLYLSFFLGALWEAAFDGVLFFPSGVWSAKDRIILGNISRPFGLSLYVLRHFSLLSTVLGPSTEWAEIVKLFGSTLMYIYILMHDYFFFNSIFFDKNVMIFIPKKKIIYIKMLGSVRSLSVCASPRWWPYRSDVVNEELPPTTVLEIRPRTQPVSENSPLKN